MRYLHTMLRVRNLDAALNFYCNLLGLEEVRRRVDEKNKFTLVFLAAPEDAAGAKADWQQVLKLSPGTPAAASAQDNLAHLSDQPATGQNLLTGPAAKKTKP